MPLGAQDIDSANYLSGVGQLLTLIVIFILVIVITLFATRYIANYQKGGALAGNIEVVETHRLTANKYVQIIKISGKYLAIAIGKDEVRLLAELDPAEVKAYVPKETALPDFAGVLKKFKQKIEKDNNNEED